MISEDELPQKDKTRLSSQLMSSLPSLSDEIIENILSRIPRWNYPKLSLVSKRFISLLSSPELYTTRSNLGTSEPCIYFCVETAKTIHTSPQWFTFSMKPHEILTGNGEMLNDYSLIPLPSSSHPPPVPCESTVAVGSDIYIIGGGDELSSSVRILDCRSHTWRDAPNMTVARSEAMAVYLDEKIYVMGGCEIDESANWFEVFDIKTQTWRALPSPGADHELCSRFIVVNPNALEGKLYVATDTKDYTYEPKDGIWKVAREKSSFKDILYSCVIENVMYRCYGGYLKWYDSEGKKWREIKGLGELRENHTRGLTTGNIGFIVLNYGGKIVLVWRQQLPEQQSKNTETKIWCTKIALENRRRGEIWGKTEWINTVLTVPNCLACVAVSM